MLNLALEKQAIGRVHRLGQTRPVTVSGFGLILLGADGTDTEIRFKRLYMPTRILKMPA